MDVPCSYEKTENTSYNNMRLIIQRVKENRLIHSKVDFILLPIILAFNAGIFPIGIWKENQDGNTTFKKCFQCIS